MVKTPTANPDVFLVGPVGRQIPWCNKCHKFLKSENAPHDCRRPDLHSSRSKAVPGSKKRIRLTPKTRDALEEIFRAAARDMCMKGVCQAIAQAKGDKEILHKAKSFQKKSSKSAADITKKYNKLIKRFL
jgi:hypothetical protein